MAGLEIEVGDDVAAAVRSAVEGDEGSGGSAGEEDGGGKQWENRRLHVRGLSGYD